MSYVGSMPSRAFTHFERNHDLPPFVDPPLREPPVKPAFDAPLPLSTSLPMVSGTVRTCQWLEGEAKDLNWCGKSVAWRGCSWCADHEKVVWPSGRPRLRGY